MSKFCIAVLTGKSRELILTNGGTSAWALTPAKVKRMKYAICTRHASPPYDPGPGSPGPEAHGSAFLVGRIADVEFQYPENGRNRFLVRFDGYAEVDVPDFWDGSRNPVRYLDEADAEQRGIDFDSLKFKPMPKTKVSAAPARPTSEAKPLTILAAKQGLAATFNVPIDAIEIMIRG